MIKGFYAAVSSMIVNSYKQQVLSQNISNLETPGFKQVLTTAKDFMQTSVLYSPGNVLMDARLDAIGQVGLGADLGAEKIDFTQGGLQSTENPYDLAIQGNGFFRLQTPEGIRYTRDGRFIRDAANTLVSVVGVTVLNSNNQPITLPIGAFSVGPDGVIEVNDQQVGQLGISTFADPWTELVQDGGNKFSGPAQSTGEDDWQIAQSYLEMSNSNPTYLMTEMIQVARSYETAQKMVQNQDELLGKTIASLGRIG